MISHAVVSVATGHFERCLLKQQMSMPGERFIAWTQSFPPGSPPHGASPFAFKVYAIEAAIEMGADIILWADSSIYAVKPLEPLWQLIERDGYWFSKNYGYINGDFCSESAYPALFPGVDLEVARAINSHIPCVIGGAFGLNMRTEIAQSFLRQWKDIMLRGGFAGSDNNHRHDQTAASVVAWRLGMRLTEPPQWITEEGVPGSEETILGIQRCR